LELTLSPLEPDNYGYALFFEDISGAVWVSETFDFTMGETVTFASAA